MAGHTVEFLNENLALERWLKFARNQAGNDRFCKGGWNHAQQEAGSEVDQFGEISHRRKE